MNYSINGEKATRWVHKQKMHKVKHVCWIIHAILSYVYY